MEVNAHLLVRRGDYRSVAHIRFPFSWSYRALIISTSHAINVVNYIPTRPLHKAAPRREHGHRGLPLSLPSPLRHPCESHHRAYCTALAIAVTLLSPLLAFHPHMRKGAAPSATPSVQSGHCFTTRSTTYLFHRIAGLTRGAVSAESRQMWLLDRVALRVGLHEGDGEFVLLTIKKVGDTPLDVTSHLTI